LLAGQPCREDANFVTVITLRGVVLTSLAWRTFTVFLYQSRLTCATHKRGVGDGRHIFVCPVVVIATKHWLGTGVGASWRTTMSGMILLSLILTLGLFAYLVYALLKAERF